MRFVGWTICSQINCNPGPYFFLIYKFAEMVCISYLNINSIVGIIVSSLIIVTVFAMLLFVFSYNKEERRILTNMVVSLNKKIL